MFNEIRYKENPYKVGDKEYFEAWWRKDELILCEVLQVSEAKKYDNYSETFAPSVLVRPLEGNPHLRYISLKRLRIEE